MDLIYTTRGWRRSDDLAVSIDDDGGDASSNCSFRESRRRRLGLSCVSSQNILLFSTTSSYPTGEYEESPKGKRSGHLLSYRVFAVDLNTPWDAHLVCERAAAVTCLCWDASGISFVLADADGHVEFWSSNQYLVSSWRCILRKTVPGETFIAAKFVQSAKQIYLNAEKLESVLHREKFLQPRHYPHRLAQPFVHQKVVACVLVSKSSLTALVTLGLGGSSGLVTKCPNGVRRSIELASLTYLKDGSLVAAVSNGLPSSPVRCFSLSPQPGGGHQLSLSVEDFPSISLKSSHDDNGTDLCEAVVSLNFVKEDYCDSLLVATRHKTGGRVQLWELDEQIPSLHKMFVSEVTVSAVTNNKVCQFWRYIEEFTGPAAQVVAVATPSSSLQPPCYVTVAYSDGSIQCLLRDSLQQISSVDLPRNLWEDENPAPAKMSCGGCVSISSICFTSTWNALVAVDTLGQLYLYRMSPITDPGGPHTVPYLVTMLEYCLMSGRDFWDVILCAKSPAQLEKVSEKLFENFEQQPEEEQEYFYARFMSILLSLQRLGPNCEVEAADSHARLLLTSVVGAFKTLLRTSESSGSVSERDKITYEKIGEVLACNKDETDVDNFTKVLLSAQQEFFVDPTALNSLKNLIQWTANLALHLAASAPEFKFRKGPLHGLHNDPDILAKLRQLLLLIRMWSNSSLNDSCQPSFTKTAEANFDVVAKLFALITKLRESSQEEAFQDDCLRLSSQVVIPPLNVHIRSRGVAAFLQQQRGPMTFDYGLTPEAEATFLEGGVSSLQIVDCINQTYLGTNPYSAKQCTRCHGMTLSMAAGASRLSSLASAWESRWQRHCICGGNWKLKYLH